MTTTASAGTSKVARPPKLRQMPGLDGLRALAVTAVIVYHLSSSALPGGYLGVDVFFVISGYLITALLLAELGQSGRISLRGFYARRARRILPAVLVLLVVVTLVAAIFARDALSDMWADVVASMFFVMNWRLVAEHHSYLATFGRPPLLLHLWSLAVEEQFYLLWPLTLLILRRRISRDRLGVALLGGAVVSSVLMAVLYTHGDPSAVYFATDTHAQGLLVGAALAAALPPWRMPSEVPDSSRRLLDQAGLAALAIVLIGFATFGFDSAFTYRGGVVLVDIATAVLVLSVVHAAGTLGGVFSRQPLRWAGQRSYSLYLWHWPIFEMTRPGIDISLTGTGSVILRLGLTCMAAEVSYRLVEQPWRSGRAQALLKRAFSAGRARRLGTVAAVPVIAMIVSLATAPTAAVPAVLAEGSTPAARANPTAPAQTRPPARPSTVIASLSDLLLGEPPPPTPAANTVASTAGRGGVPGRDLPILAIGDSVMLAASPALEATFGPDITVDAAVGRQVYTGLSRLAAYRSSGALARYKTVVVDLGTNGAFEPAEFQEMTRLLEGVPHVVVFNVHAGVSWAAESNSTIGAGVAAHPGWMVLARWNKTASNRKLLYSDGVHPNGLGAAAYDSLLVSALVGRAT